MLLASFKNDFGAIAVESLRTGFEVKFWDFTNGDQDETSEIFQITENRSVIKKFFAYREDLYQMELNFNQECLVIKEACSLADGEIEEAIDENKYPTELTGFFREVHVATELAITEILEG